MLKKLRNRQRGFTLIELLIVVAIIGIIAALLIPNFLDALQKAKQKRTVADSRNVGTAEMSWLTDQISAAAAGGTAASQVDLSKYSAVTIGVLTSLLVPQYIQSVPTNDGWKDAYTYWLKTSSFTGQQIMAICSKGRDNAGCSAGAYTAAGFDPTDYDQDIIWADGFFVRWPQKTT
jgi:prepilin-type N-terminal cleavage/methylation domain-containing protein